MGRKRKLLSRKAGFKNGYVPWHAGKSLNYNTEVEVKNVKRLSKSVFDRRVTKNTENVLSVQDISGDAVDMCILRPKSKSPDTVDMYLQNAEQDSSTGRSSNKVYSQRHVESLFNTEIKNHIKYKAECGGDLKFDVENEQQRGVSWRERLICTECDFKSKYHNLYDTIDSNKRGSKTSAMNIQAQIGLMTTLISSKNFREILMASNIPPPSRTGMQKTANKVAKNVEDINRESMRDIRRNLVAENKDCGAKDETMVRVESDARYNNPIFKTGSTPFQAGTQVVTTMCENNTVDKKIISIFTGNKLCTTAALLRNNGMEITCPNHDGNCTANIAEHASIGDESAYSASCANEVSDYLTITHLTTDGDSKSFEGVKRVHGQDVEPMKDVRHLANSMCRALNKCTFSDSMFPGAKKPAQKSRFALDIKRRCVAELNKGFEVHNGQMYKLKESMPSVIKAIIMCYKGYCGQMCKLYSYVCAGLP